MDTLTQILSQYIGQSFIATVALAFVGGVLSSFTPCVYPMIPITAAVVSSYSINKSRWSSFFISLVYISGLAAVYAALGFFAAITGKMFGQLAVNSWINIIVGSIIVILSLSMFDLFNITLPIYLQNSIRPARKGVIGVFILGMASGFVAAPCTAPPLAVLLTYIGTRSEVVLGVTSMLAFSLGMSMVLLLIGTFTGMVSRLPKSGKWMLRVKYLIGLVLLLTGIYFYYQAWLFW